MTTSPSLPTTPEATSIDETLPEAKESPMPIGEFGDKITLLAKFLAESDPVGTLTDKARLRAQIKIASDWLEGMKPTETAEEIELKNTLEAEKSAYQEKIKNAKIKVRLKGRQETLDFLSAKNTDFDTLELTLVGADRSATYPHFSSDVALAPLVFTVQPAKINELHAKLNDETAKTLRSAIGFYKECDIGSALRYKIASSGLLDIVSLIKLSKNTLSVSYGTFKLAFGDDVPKFRGDSYQVSPVMHDYVVDRVSDLVGPLEIDQRNMVYSNLKHLMDDHAYDDYNFGLVTEFVSKYPDAWPNETQELLSFHLSLIRRFFLMYVLPVLLLDTGIRSEKRLSFLKPDFGVKMGDFINESLLIFLSKFEPVAKAIKIHKNKMSFMADLDANGSGQEKTRSAVESTFEPEKREEYFRISKSDPFGDGSVTETLTGFTMGSKALERLGQLSKNHPHFSKVVEFLEPYVKVSYLTGRPFKFPPLLIAGPPGIGKSKFMDELHDVFGYPRRVMHGSQITHGSSIAGLQHTWGSAHQGYVSETLLETKLINPLITLDEIDKTGSFRDEQISIASALMRVLEPLEAKNFRDAFFNCPHDVSKVNWIFTCNQPLTLLPALLTRMNTIYVYPPTERHSIDNVHNSIWLDQIKSFGVEDMVSSGIDKECLDYLAEIYYDELQFRKSYRLLERAMTVILTSIKPGQKSTLRLEAFLNKKGSTEQKLGIILH